MHWRLFFRRWWQLDAKVGLYGLSLVDGLTWQHQGTIKALLFRLFHLLGRFEIVPVTMGKPLELSQNEVAHAYLESRL